jgi:hypothetical protein
VGVATTKTAKATGGGFPAIINGPGFTAFTARTITVLLPAKRLFAFPVTPSELGFVFSLPRLQVQNFLVETVPLCFGPRSTQLHLEVKQGVLRLVENRELRKKTAADCSVLLCWVG